MPLPRGLLRLTDEELNELLSNERTLRAGTVGAEGAPHVAPLWFVWVDGAIWLSSLRRSRRSSDLAAGSKVALCCDTGHDYGELRGAVLYGTPVEAAEGPELTAAQAAFARKYWGGDVFPQVKSHVWLKIDPERIASWDFRKIPVGGDTHLPEGGGHEAR